VFSVTVFTALLGFLVTASYGGLPFLSLRYQLFTTATLNSTNLTGNKGRLARKGDNLTAIIEPIV
jgi:hypothetical protein